MAVLLPDAVWTAHSPKIPVSLVVALIEPYFLMPHSTAWQPKRKLQNSKNDSSSSWASLHAVPFLSLPWLSSPLPSSLWRCHPSSFDTVCTPARVPFLLPERKNSPLPGNCSPSEVVLKKKFYRIKFTISLLVHLKNQNKHKLHHGQLNTTQSLM